MKQGEDDREDFPESSDPSYLFRADDDYRPGDPVGLVLDSETAQNAFIQTFLEHVLDKQAGQTSRYVSFSNAIKLPGGGGAQKFTKRGKSLKVAWRDIQELETQGTIRVYTPEQVANVISQHPKKRIRKQANNVRSVMEKNGEILVEGQIPGELMMIVN